MTDRQGEKERRTGRVRQFLRSVRTEMVFSGESLRVNGRGLLFGLIVGLVVGLCGGVFARLLEVAAMVREGTRLAM